MIPHCKRFSNGGFLQFFPFGFGHFAYFFQIPKDLPMDIMIVLAEGSGSNRHEVKSVIKNSDGSFAVDIERKVPGTGTEDMAGWHIILEIECGKINPLTKVDVTVK